ncbi:MAG: aminomethyl transferase family protein [Planctomycetota bacterium]|jgi:aminomethyltransferase|nr:aminomethyl transferase family protein [Planctomycetota bacterium]
MYYGGETELRRTVLHSRHRELGAKLVDFGGWEMPLWYRAGAVKEHMAVVTAAGLFDTSHMDVVHVGGSGARAFLDRAFTRDISTLQPGRAGYGAFLGQNGDCIDDAIVYPIEEGRWSVVVNAGMGPEIARHLRGLPGSPAEIGEPAERATKIDLQGPKAQEILAMILPDPAALFEKLPYFSFKGDFDFSKSAVRLRNGVPALLSRTGYTGELGFEIFLPLDRAGPVWDELLALGGEKGLLPCGLAARDSLRTGAALALSHRDIGHWPYVNHPWRFALPYSSDGAFTKDFVGRAALEKAAPSARHTLAFAGYDPRRVEPADATALVGGKPAGMVTTIVTDMAIGRIGGGIVSIASPDRPEGWMPHGLACGFVRVDAHLSPGSIIVLKDGRREIEVEIRDEIRPNRTARRKLALNELP